MLLLSLSRVFIGVTLVDDLFIKHGLPCRASNELYGFGNPNCNDSIMMLPFREFKQDGEVTVLDGKLLQNVPKMKCFVEILYRRPKFNRFGGRIPLDQ
jgi:hypothetical protein